MIQYSLAINKKDNQFHLVTHWMNTSKSNPCNNPLIMNGAEQIGYPR